MDGIPSLRPDSKHIRILIAAEMVFAIVSTFLSYSAISAPVSNAQGNVIRSTVNSGLYSALLVFSFGVLAFTVSWYYSQIWKHGVKLVLVSGLGTAAFSLPFLIYYNFYYSYVVVISGGRYTVYPYAVQPAIPLMIGLFIAFISIFYMIPRRRKRILFRTVFIGKNELIFKKKEDEENKNAENQ